MAFRGEASVASVADVTIGSGEATAVLDHSRVAPVDAFRVRLALGLMAAIAIVDCLLYLPRLF